MPNKTKQAFYQSGVPRLNTPTGSHSEERQDKGDQACEVMRELVSDKMSHIIFVSCPNIKSSATYSSIPCIQISSLCDFPPPLSLHFCSSQEPWWHRTWVSHARVIRPVCTTSSAVSSLVLDLAMFTGDVVCANTASINSSNAYMSICNGKEFVLSTDCPSSFGCKTKGLKNAVTNSFSYIHRFTCRHLHNPKT